jgi:hypothetical protein
MHCHPFHEACTSLGPASAVICEEVYDADDTAQEMQNNAEKTEYHDGED